MLAEVYTGRMNDVSVVLRFLVDSRNRINRSGCPRVSVPLKTGISATYTLEIKNFTHNSRSSWETASASASFALEVRLISTPDARIADYQLINKKTA